MSGEILVRVVPRPGEEGDLAGASLTERFTERVDELGDSIAAIAGQLRKRLELELVDEAPPAWRLDAIDLNFSLALEAGAGVVVAKAKTTAGFEVALHWNRSGA